MFELSDRSVVVIETLIQGSIAWRSPAELARLLGWTLDEINDILCDLDTTGWIDVRDTDMGVSVTLSRRAASRWNARNRFTRDQASHQRKDRFKSNPRLCRESESAQEAWTLPPQFVTPHGGHPSIPTPQGFTSINRFT